MQVCAWFPRGEKGGELQSGRDARMMPVDAAGSELPRRGWSPTRKAKVVLIVSIMSQ